MVSGETSRRSPLKFFLLVFALSVPFWAIGALAERRSIRPPLNLPVSALQLVCPLIAASILTYREERLEGLKRLARRVFDRGRIRNPLWYVPIVFLMPARMVVSYEVMRAMGMVLPAPSISLPTVLVFLAAFSAAAVAEEVGWTAYATDPMQERWGALKAALIIGVVWSAWHVIPDIQAHRAASWIGWHRFGAVMTRIPMIWLYNCTGKSVFAVILLHAMDNVSLYSLTDGGAHYEPAVPGMVMAAIAGVVAVVWKPGRHATEKDDR